MPISFLLQKTIRSPISPRMITISPVSPGYLSGNLNIYLRVNFYSLAPPGGHRLPPPALGVGGLVLSRDRGSVPPSGSPPRLAAIIRMAAIRIRADSLLLELFSVNRDSTHSSESGQCLRLSRIARDCPEYPVIACNDRNVLLSRCITLMMTTVHLPADQGRHELYCEDVLVN